MDRHFCKRVSKFKLTNSMVPPWEGGGCGSGACRKPPKFCPDEFTVITCRIVLKFKDMIDMDMKFCKKGPPSVCVCVWKGGRDWGREVACPTPYAS